MYSFHPYPWKTVEWSIIHMLDGNYTIHVSNLKPSFSTFVTIIQSTLLVQCQLQWETEVPGSKFLGQFNFKLYSHAQCELVIDSHPTCESKLNSHHWRELTGFTWLMWIWDGFFDRMGIQDSLSRCECKARSHGWRECRVGFTDRMWIPRIRKQSTFPICGLKQ